MYNKKPKIIFNISRFFQEEIGVGLSKINSLYNFLREFKKYFKFYENKILFYIPKYTGFKWEEDEINVWIFCGYRPSISFPLLLNWYNGDKEFALFILIHELTHRNLYFLLPIIKKRIDTLELEAIINLVTIQVAKKVFDKRTVVRLKKLAYFNGEYKYVWKRVEELEKCWNLEKKPLRAYIKKNKNIRIVK